jgi:hypothetical protein
LNRQNSIPNRPDPNCDRPIQNGPS